ncbi:hypothetical protein GCM10027597_32360 [Saccharopolyspora tripterygii]
MLGISRQAYYQWESNPISQCDWDDAHLINAALEIHADDPTEGYRFVADELARRGFTVSENRVWRICSMQKIFSLHAKKKGRNPKAGPPVHDDLVGRAFTASTPNVIWLTDLTEQELRLAIVSWIETKYRRRRRQRRLGKILDSLFVRSVPFGTWRPKEQDCQGMLGEEEECLSAMLADLAGEPITIDSSKA